MERPRAPRSRSQGRLEFRSEMGALGSERDQQQLAPPAPIFSRRPMLRAWMPNQFEGPGPSCGVQRSAQTSIWRQPSGRPSLRSILVLYRYCIGTTLALQRHSAGTTWVPHQYHTGSARVLLWYCSGTLPEHWYFTAATRVLHGYCMGLHG